MRGMLSHSCLDSGVLDLCHTFCFMMQQMFSFGERSGQHPDLLLWSHAVVAVGIDAAHCLSEKALSGLVHILLWNQLWWCPSRYGSCSPRTIREKVFELNTDTLILGKMGVSLSTFLSTVFHFWFDPFEFWPTEDGGVSRSSSHMLFTSLRFDFVDCTASCVHRQWFLKVFLNSCSNFHDRIMSDCNAVSPQGMKIMSIQNRFSALSLAHKFFQIFRVFWWYYVPYMMISSQFSQF